MTYHTNLNQIENRTNKYLLPAKYKIIRKLVFVIFIWLFYTPSSHALELIQNDTLPVSEEEKEVFIKKLHESQIKINSLSGKFHQEKHLSMLLDDVKLEGIVFFKKPNLLRWETNKPDRTLLVVDGKKMVIFNPDKKKNQVYLLSESYKAGILMDIITSIMFGTLDQMMKRFTLNLYQSNNKIIFQLIPKSKNIAKSLTSIQVDYEASTGFPLGFATITPSGDTTKTDFFALVHNQEINPDFFKITQYNKIKILDINKLDDK